MHAFDHAYWPPHVAIAWVATRDRDFVDQVPFDKSMRYLAAALAKYAVDNDFKSAGMSYKNSHDAFLALRDATAEGSVQAIGDPYYWFAEQSGLPPRKVCEPTRVIDRWKSCPPSAAMTTVVRTVSYRRTCTRTEAAFKPYSSGEASFWHGSRRCRQRLRPQETRPRRQKLSLATLQNSPNGLTLRHGCGSRVSTSASVRFNKGFGLKRVNWLACRR